MSPDDVRKAIDDLKERSPVFNEYGEVKYHDPSRDVILLRFLAERELARMERERIPIPQNAPHCPVHGALIPCWECAHVINNMNSPTRAEGE